MRTVKYISNKHKDFLQIILWIILWVLNLQCAALQSLRKMYLIFVTFLKHRILYK